MSMYTQKKQDNSKQLLKDAQKTSAEAMEHGRRAMEGLESQEETLKDTEDILESNEYTLDKTMKVLRGMTWSGMFYNAFNSDPQISDVNGKGNQTSIPSSSADTSSNSFNSNSNHNQHQANRSALLNDQNHAQSVNKNNQEEPELLEISQNVNQLLSMSHTMGMYIVVCRSYITILYMYYC